MKRGIILAAVFLLLGSVFVAAVLGDPPTPPGSDVILKLSSPTNAHGEVWNGTAYTTEVLYSDIFGGAYPSADTNTCTGTNTVLKLSADTNAHAEGPTGSVYTTNVCYGDMNCQLYEIPAGAPDCPVGAGAQCVVKLSGTTNAHLETCDNTNYGYSICCTSVTEVNCTEYTTKESCWAASPNCTWTPPETNSSPEGGCCPYDGVNL